MEEITKETSPFIVGVTVAHIVTPCRFGPLSIRKKIIERVTASGRFTLVGAPGVLYTPKIEFNKFIGYSKEYPRDHIELWTAEIEADIEERNNEETLKWNIGEIADVVNKLHPKRDQNKINLAHHVLSILDDSACEKILRGLIENVGRLDN